MTLYPYFLYPAICELRRATDPGRVEHLKEFIAANVGNREALLLLIGDLDDSLINFYPDVDNVENIDDTIDSFILRFGNNPSPLIPPAIIPEAKPAQAPRRPTSPAEAPVKNSQPEIGQPPVKGKDLPLSQEEVMKKVKNLVKNRDYDQAIKIMEAFYLNNPKKSVYFADQMRFLRKLKLNESKK